MVRKPVPGYLFPFGPLLAVVAIGVNGNSAAGQKLTPYFDICGVHQVDKVVNSRVAVFGAGGVGGFTIEGLVRSGVGAIDLTLPIYHP